ncbi:MAG: hypothetical protein M3N02_09270 [Pseudomonadota bacterium]|nr:hypothetical protein [Pseudomonadota bacterium]
MSEYLHLENIQGNILRGYRSNLRYVRHLILEVTDLSAARRFLGSAAAGEAADVPRITRATVWGNQNPETCFNVGITYEGMRALGTPKAMLATFPTEFVEGMAKRALKLGDFGDSAPANWPAPFKRPERVHLIATAYAQDFEDLARITSEVAKSFNVLDWRDGSARDDAKVLGKAFRGDGSANTRVFFGHADSISQPRFKIEGYPDPKSAQPTSPLGAVLLGYDTPLEGVRFRVPMSEELGKDGSFNAFRVLEQDCRAFEKYLTEAAEILLELERAKGPQLLPVAGEAAIRPGLDRLGALREVIAAQMCGRWRNGTPVDTSPYRPLTEEELTPEVLNDFDYSGASNCPAGAHIRRVNPRSGQIVQRAANHTRRLVRRGMPYGPDFDAANPDDEPRGLLGNFIGASIGGQFEAVMCDWLNLGLHDPTITRRNDPLIGANTQETSVFDLRLMDGTPYRLRGFPRFVTTKGGAYTFLPSLKAIKFLAELRG